MTVLQTSARDVRPLADPVAEGLRIVERARREGLDVYLLGGVAIAARRPPQTSPLLERPFNDIDVIATTAAGRQVSALLTALGYVADADFNAVNGRTRMLFRDEANARDLDVLIGEFVMCHELPVLDEATRAEATIPLADLLLTKLQIVEINRKDVWDAYNLLHDHELDADRIAQLCARDWGLWRTVTGNLALLRRPEHAGVLADAARALVSERIARIEQAIDGAKKSRRWSMRSRIGERVRWYEEPEEAH
jgi:hypothetical protein